MGEVTRDQIAELLRKENPGARQIEIQIYSDALIGYFEAKRNIQENGAIVLHPRTAAPIDNPYAKLLQAFADRLLKMKHIKSGNVLAAIQRN